MNNFSKYESFNLKLILVILTNIKMNMKKSYVPPEVISMLPATSV